MGQEQEVKQKQTSKKEYMLVFKDNNLAVDQAEKGSMSSNSWNVKYLLCVKVLFEKYVWVKPLKDKKSKAFLCGFN